MAFADHSTHGGTVAETICMIDELTDLASNVRSSEVALEVRWSLTGNKVCAVVVSPDTCVAKAKQQICDQTGVPVLEQRLFLQDAELTDAFFLHPLTVTVD